VNPFLAFVTVKDPSSLAETLSQKASPLCTGGGHPHQEPGRRWGRGRGRASRRLRERGSRHVGRLVVLTPIVSAVRGGGLTTLAQPQGSYAIGEPVSRSDLRSLRIQLQPPAPDSENLLATIPAMLGAPLSSWVTVSRQNPDGVGTIS